MSDDNKNNESREEVKTAKTLEYSFQGDVNRDSVDVDLRGLVSLMGENSKLKDQVQALKETQAANPWQKWIYFAQMVDAWRIFPRIFISVYLYILYQAFMWFIGLPDPTMSQAGLISTIIGAGAAWFGLYVSTRGDASDKDK